MSAVECFTQSDKIALTFDTCCHRSPKCSQLIYAFDDENRNARDQKCKDWLACPNCDGRRNGGWAWDFYNPGKVRFDPDFSPPVYFAQLKYVDPVGSAQTFPTCKSPATSETRYDQHTVWNYCCVAEKEPKCGTNGIGCNLVPQVSAGDVSKKLEYKTIISQWYANYN